MDSIKLSENGIIANIDSLKSAALRKALKRRGIVGRSLSVLRRQARHFNTSYIRRLQSEGDTEHGSICSDRDSDSSLSAQPATGTSVSCLPLMELANASLTQWNLQYDGTRNVREFIKLVDALSSRTNTSHQTISRRFTDLITGNVLCWFQSIKHQNLSWLELKNLLIQRFEPPNAQSALKVLIYTSKQDSKESASRFFRRIRNQNRCLLTPIPEEELLIIMKYGLRLPNYASPLPYREISSATQIENQIMTTSHNALKPVVSCRFCKKIGHLRTSCKALSVHLQNRVIRLQNHTRVLSRFSWPSDRYVIPAGVDFSVPPPKIVKLENTINYV